MAVNFSQRIGRTTPDRSPMAGIIMMAAAVVLVLFILVLNGTVLESYPYPYVLPWLAGLLIVFLAPTLFLFYKGNLRLENPIVFATWSYFIPAFIIGGVAFSAGWSRPYFVAFIQDADYNLPYTIVLVMLGFGALSIGYFLPIGRRIGAFIADRLPGVNHSPTSYMIPGVVLLVLGIGNSILAIALGILGFQRAEAINSYDGLIFLTTLFWMQASFLLWYVIFYRRRVDTPAVIIVLLLIGTSVSKALLAGSRGSLMNVFAFVILAYVMSGREFKFKQVALTSVIMAVLLVMGMIYGTTFRTTKGSETAVSFDRYADNVSRTFDEIGRQDNAGLMEFAFAHAAERLDAVSSLAVVVSTYEQLRPYEESYGLDNNIWKDTTTFFIPRVIWPDKPVASEPRRYSDLYFNFSESSFTITPIGDLLRNFGVIGVALGMLLLGIILRTIYRTLIEDQSRVVWRAVLYFMLLTAVSYESFFGTTVPYLFKIGVTAVLGVFIVNILARQFDSRQRPAA
jgi:hypothetical protein